jgi:hypothetical protein
MTTFGTAENKSDDDLLEGIAFWESKESEFIAAREPDGAAQAREAAEQHRAEARRRGLVI